MRVDDGLVESTVRRDIDPSLAERVLQCSLDCNTLISTDSRTSQTQQKLYLSDRSAHQVQRQVVNSLISLLDLIILGRDEGRERRGELSCNFRAEGRREVEPEEVGAVGVRRGRIDE